MQYVKQRENYCYCDIWKCDNETLINLKKEKKTNIVIAILE